MAYAIRPYDNLSMTNDQRQKTGASSWSDYQLLDFGYGKRLERFGSYQLVRPDVQAAGKPHLSFSTWERADAVFERQWKILRPMPPKWLLHWRHIALWVKLAPFKHTGVFPEHCGQWAWLQDTLTKTARPIHMLNLFGYTGIATLVAAAAGSRVTHVDASRPAIAWARENQAASGLTGKPIRWIVDDARDYVRREIRRGVRYDAILMDPPAYGHGVKETSWALQRDFPALLRLCRDILAAQPLFLLTNIYTVSLSVSPLKKLLQNVFGSCFPTIDTRQLGLRETGTNRVFPTGRFGMGLSSECVLMESNHVPPSYRACVPSGG